MKSKKIQANFTTGTVGDHFLIRVENHVRSSGKAKILEEVFTVRGNVVSLRLSPETALKLAEYIDRELEDYDFSKPSKRSKSDS